MKIYIEGNIGCGKSTFVNMLKNKYPERFKFLVEPVETWRSYKDEDGVNLLDNFYRNQKRWSYTFQMAAFMTRIRDIGKMDSVNTDKSLVIERSVYTDRYCFAELGFKNGSISKMEWEVYNDWYKWLSTNFKKTIQADMVFYLKCPPEVCASRIAERNRSEECGIPIEYLRDLHTQHEKMMEKFRERGILVITIDATRDIYSDSDYFSSIFNTSLS